MYKLHNTPNETKNYINLYNKNISKNPNTSKEKKFSLNLSRYSRNSLFLNQNIIKKSQTQSPYNKKIRKIKNIFPNRNKSCENINNSNSMKSMNLPICVSFMTNNENYINNINDKFKVRNFSNFVNYQTFYDKSFLSNNNSSMNLKKNNKENKILKNFLNLKSIGNKRANEVRKIMSKLNFSSNQDNSNSSVNIKNYNYFIGTIDKSVNIFNQKNFFEKKKRIGDEQIKNIKLKNEKNKNPKGKRNYLDIFMNNTNNTNFKLNLIKKKQLHNILFKRINSNLNISADNENNIIKNIKDKETTIDDSIKPIKKKDSSKILTLKLDKKKENEENIKQKNDIKGLDKIKKEIEDKENNEKSNKKKNSKGKNKSKSKVSFAIFDNEEEKNKKEEDNKENKDNKDNNKVEKKNNRRNSLFEKNMKKRIYNLLKKSEKEEKTKFNNIIIKKEKQRRNKLYEKNKKFIEKILTDNQLEEEPKLKKIIKESKISIISYHKNRIEKFIPTFDDKYKYNNFYFFTKYVDILSTKKDIMISKQKLKLYKASYITLKKEYILYISFYSYTSLINKCWIEINSKNYIFTNLDFSSINLPKVENQDAKLIKKEMLLGSINPRTKYKKGIFSTVKTKFIENNRYKYNKNTQNASMNFIKKELEFYNVLKTFNFLDEDQEKKININSNIRSPSSRLSFYRRKKTMNFSHKKNRYTQITRISSKLNTQSKNKLSILENKKFFSKEKGKLLFKKFKNSINASLLFYKINSTNNFKKILPKVSINTDYTMQKDYQAMNKVIKLIQDKKSQKDLSYSQHGILKQIKGKENIESILRLFILEGEEMLFKDYFNEVYKEIDINTRDKEGNTLLILSVKSGINNISKILLEKGVAVNIQNYEGNSALHYALGRKNFFMADLLKIYGAQEDLINKKGFSPWECLGKSIDNKND